MGTSIASRSVLTAADAIDALRDARERTVALVESVADEDLERVYSPLMSPLAWDLGHIAAYEDLWLVHRFGGRTLLREGVVDELFLTVAPKLAGGGSSPTIASGPPLPDVCELGLEWALERRGSLYLRYSLG